MILKEEKKKLEEKDVKINDLEIKLYCSKEEND